MVLFILKAIVKFSILKAIFGFSILKAILGKKILLSGTVKALLLKDPGLRFNCSLLLFFSNDDANHCNFDSSTDDDGVVVGTDDANSFMFDTGNEDDGVVILLLLFLLAATVKFVLLFFP